MQSIFLWTSFEAKSVSIFILTEGDADGLFLNIMDTYLLFACACDFTYFLF
jgi:hypothetical protein